MAAGGLRRTAQGVEEIYITPAGRLPIPCKYLKNKEKIIWYKGCFDGFEQPDSPTF
jgi:hypothetical protein